MVSQASNQIYGKETRIVLRLAKPTLMRAGHRSETLKRAKVHELARTASSGSDINVHSIILNMELHIRSRSLNENTPSHDAVCDHLAITIRPLLGGVSSSGTRTAKGASLGTRRLRVEKTPFVTTLSWEAKIGTKSERYPANEGETFDEWMGKMRDCDVVEMLIDGVVEGEGRIDVRCWEMGIYGF